MDGVGPNNEMMILELIGSVLFGITYLAFVSCIGLLDAVQVTKLSKGMVPGISALAAGSVAFIYEFILATDSDYEVMIPWIDGSFSFCSLMASANRILAIFLFRQSFF